MNSRIFQRRRIPSFKRGILYFLERIAAVSDYVTTDCSTPLSVFERYVIVLEDHRYFRHHGIDWISVFRVCLQQLIFRRVGGASTIEMQFVRTIFDDREKSLTRKCREAVTAWLLNFHFDKVSLLRGYLSCAYFGSGLIGAENASIGVFGKGTYELSEEEASLLAAMLVVPAPISRGDAWRKRLQRRALYGQRLFQSYSKC